MRTDRTNTLIAVLCGIGAAAVIIGTAALILRGPVVEYGWNVLVVSWYKFLLAAAVVGAVALGLTTTVKVYRRLERGGDS